MKLHTYTLLIDYRNGRTETVKNIGENEADAKEIAMCNLRDEDKEWVRSITVIDLTPLQVEGMDSQMGGLS